jgi:hypothetical protein
MSPYPYKGEADYSGYGYACVGQTALETLFLLKVVARGQLYNTSDDGATASLDTRGIDSDDSSSQILGPSLQGSDAGQGISLVGVRVIVGTLAFEAAVPVGWDAAVAAEFVGRGAFDVAARFAGTAQAGGVEAGLKRQKGGGADLGAF